MGFEASGIAPADSPVTLTLSSGYANGALALDATLGVSLESANLGIDVTPALTLTIAGATAKAAILPLGESQASTLAIELLPSFHVSSTPAAPGALVEKYGIPLVADLLIAATEADFAKSLWKGGPPAEHVLKSAKLIDVSGAPPKYSLASPFPQPEKILAGLLEAIASVKISVTSSPPLSLEFVDDSGRIGAQLVGSIALSGEGSPRLSLLLGAPAAWLGADAGVTLYLFTQAGGFQFSPELAVRGLGLGLAGDGDAPLLNESGFRIGALDTYLAFDVDLRSGKVSGLGGGVEIEKLGLPISQFDSSTASNPVAASLLDSGGSTGGEDSKVNPAVDVIAYDLDGTFTIEFAGTSGPVVIPVHASFGPVYLDQIDLAVSDSEDRHARHRRRREDRRARCQRDRTRARGPAGTI